MTVSNEELPFKLAKKMRGEEATQGRVEEVCTYINEATVGLTAGVRFKDRRARTRAVRA